MFHFILKAVRTSDKKTRTDIRCQQYNKSNYGQWCLVLSGCRPVIEMDACSIKEPDNHRPQQLRVPQEIRPPGHITPQTTKYHRDREGYESVLKTGINYILKPPFISSSGEISRHRRSERTCPQSVAVERYGNMKDIPYRQHERWCV